MARQAPPWRLPEDWAADYARLEDLIDEAIAERDERDRDRMFMSALEIACDLLERLMKQPPFEAALRNIQTQSPGEIAEAIEQLKEGNWGTVVDDLDELLRAAHLPGRHARQAVVDGVARLLTADPTTLAGAEAAQMFDRFRGEVCDVETWLGGVIDSRDRREVVQTALKGVGGAALAVAAAAAGTAGAPVAIAGAAAVAVVGGAVAVIRVVRKQRWP